MMFFQREMHSFKAQKHFSPLFSCQKIHRGLTECQREKSWSDKSLITKVYNIFTWEYVSIVGVLQGEYATSLFADFYEKILMGGLIHGPHFQLTHYAW